MALKGKKFIDLIRTTIKGKRTSIFFNVTKRKDTFKDIFTIRATLPSGQRVGIQDLSVPWHGTHSNVIDTNIDRAFQGQGFAKEFFKRSMKISKKHNKSFIRSQEILSPKQISVRQRFRSKFQGYGLGKYGEGQKLLSPKEAKEIISSEKYVGSVRASTMIPKNMGERSIDEIASSGARKAIKSGKVMFRRVRGRIVPIRVKELKPTRAMKANTLLNKMQSRERELLKKIRKSDKIEEKKQLFSKLSRSQKLGKKIFNISLGK
jgi:hypothetical protein